MNKDWSQINKDFQTQIKKQKTFSDGIKTLLNLRKILFEQIMRFKDELSLEDFCAIPFINAKGYHSKTIAYSLWHIFRIEDIVAHTLILGDEQILFKNDYVSKINSPIITTGNELVKEQIADFSKKLCISELFNYVNAVAESSNALLKNLTFSRLKEKVSDQKRKNLEILNVVSSDENAHWLIDYWCSKNIKGLLQMPFSRHWIMHIEACLKIQTKITELK